MATDGETRRGRRCLRKHFVSMPVPHMPEEIIAVARWEERTRMRPQMHLLLPLARRIVSREPCRSIGEVSEGLETAGVSRD